MNKDTTIMQMQEEEPMIEDKEWEEAKNADEPELYFKCIRDNGSYDIRRYKSSQARLVSKRTGWHLTPVDTLIC